LYEITNHNIRKSTFSLVDARSLRTLLELQICTLPAAGVMYNNDSHIIMNPVIILCIIYTPLVIIYIYAAMNMCWISANIYWISSNNDL